MTRYDEYFTNDDKPYAENINDALLISNVFDLTVPIELPKMFNNSTWVNTTSQRKCSVSIVNFKEELPNTLSISTLDNESVITGTGKLQLLVYPNFNSFGKYKSINWDSVNDNIKVNIKTKTGTTILSDIAKGTLINIPSQLQELNQIMVEVVFTANDTLKSLELVMENKNETRYGAECGISDVTDLQSNLDAKVNILDIKNNLISTDIDKPLSANQGMVLKGLVDNKSDVNHNHDNRYLTPTAVSDWVHITNIDKGDEWYYADIYVNPTLRLVDFHYYRINYYFSSTSSINIVDNVRFIVGVRNQPVDITPKMNTPLASFNATIVGGLARSSQTNPYDPVYTSLTVQSTSTGSKNINIRGMWHY